MLDITWHEDKILVAMTVTDLNLPSGEGQARWQVLTVAGGRVVDIRGYDDQDEATAAVGITT